MTIKVLGKNPLKTFNYPSRTKKKVVWEVGLWSNGEIHCGCPSSCYRKRICWHKQALIDKLTAEFGGIMEAVQFYKDDKQKRTNTNR